jgi:hypothetical protein
LARAGVWPEWQIAADDFWPIGGFPPIFGERLCSGRATSCNDKEK